MKLLLLSTFLLINLNKNVLTSKPIQFINGGYTGLTFAIHSQVEESDVFIKNLQQLIVMSSQFLYKVTNKRSRFNQVDIIVPKTWTHKQFYSKITGSQFGKSHVRIGLSRRFGDEPFTVQPRGCGQPGEFIGLSDNFIKELNNKTKQEFGSAEKHFVHEWAHFRYGVFDEYGIPGDHRYPSFYVDDGKILPTTCVKGIKGIRVGPDEKPCKIYSGGIIDPNCNFIPDPNENDARASLMFMPHSNTIDSFCDNNTDHYKYRHNKYAPSKHNILCNYKSVSQVINEHEDFSKQQTIGAYHDPIIKYYQVDDSQSSRFVLLLDVSKSMYNNGRIRLLNRAATRFVKDIIQNGIELGIIKFSDQSIIINDGNEMETINDENRKTLARKIPDSAIGGTAIGNGLLASLELLRKNGKQANGATIILVTDGNETVFKPSRIETVMPEIIKAGIKIDAICVSIGADKRLENITEITGGKVFYMNDDDTATNTFIETVFTGFVSEQMDTEVQPVILNNGNMITIGNRQLIKQIIIDRELGKNTKFFISSDDIRKLKVKFKAPDGKIYDENHFWFRKDFLLKNIQLFLPDSPTGYWEVILKNDENFQLERSIIAVLTVSSEPKDPIEQPIRLNSYFGNLEVRYPATAMIYTEITKGKTAVVGADVVALVQRPDGKVIKVKLYDDGTNFDVVANDGIYTNAFTKFSSNGRYSVSAKVESTSKTGVKKVERSNSLRIKRIKNLIDYESKSEFSFDDFEQSHDQPQLNESQNIEMVSDFTREAEVGSFKLENFSKGKDLFPPNRVLDLYVLNVDEEKLEVDLQWTSPGDDYYQGNASKIELRFGHSQYSLLNPSTFKNNTEVTEDMLIRGTLEPLEGGLLQRVKIKFTHDILGKRNYNSNKVSLYFTLRAHDDSNNTGEISNLAMVHFGYVKPILDQIIIGTSSRPFESIITQTNIDLEDSILFYHNRISIQKQHKHIIIRIPKELGKNTKFTITSDEIEQLEYYVVAPNGTVYNKHQRDFHVDLNYKYADFVIDYARPGNWKVKLNKVVTNNIYAYLSVSSCSHVTEPIKTITWIDTPFINKDSQHSAVINAEVIKRFTYVICASVIAIVDRPSSESVFVKLYDNGTGPDKVANDGLYAATFTNFNSNGKYGVIARVINDGKAKLKLGVETYNNCRD